VNALLAFPTHEKALSEGWVAVSDFVEKSQSDAFEQQIFDAGALDGAGGAMLAFPSNRDLQMAGLRVLYFGSSYG